MENVMEKLISWGSYIMYDLPFVESPTQNLMKYGCFLDFNY